MEPIKRADLPSDSEDELDATDSEGEEESAQALALNAFSDIDWELPRWKAAHIHIVTHAEGGGHQMQ